MDEELVSWFELHYDADELVDIMQIEVEELVEAFYERCREYKEGHPDG